MSALLLAVVAATLEIAINPTNPPLSKVSTQLPGFAYSEGRREFGDTDAARLYGTGAWTVRTERMDEKTLQFLRKTSTRAIFLLDGDDKEIDEGLHRIFNGGYVDLVAGFQLGSDPSGGGSANAMKWRKAVAFLSYRMRRIPVAVPSRGGVSPMLDLLGKHAMFVTRLVEDLTDCASPFESLSKAVKKKEPWRYLWTVAPRSKAGDHSDALRRARWLLEAYSAGGVEAVIGEGPAERDGFGLAMRFMFAAFRDQPVVLMHGKDPKGVEYLVLENPTGNCMCLLAVNGAKEPVRVAARVDGFRIFNAICYKVLKGKGGKSVSSACGVHSYPTLDFNLDPESVQATFFSPVK